MARRLDLVDVRILEAIGNYGPRNVTKIARKLNMPSRTVHHRLKQISSNFFLRLNLNIYHTNLGLKKAAIFTEAAPGYENLLKDSLQTNGFWIYLTRYFGNREGCFGVYTIPKANTHQFTQFLEELKNLAVARNIRFHWSTCFHSVNLSSNWFDPHICDWKFPWKSWIHEIPTATTELPLTLKDPEDWRIRGDYTDVFILKEMEKDARISFVDIAKKLNIDPRKVQYRFRNHIIKRGLMEGFKTTIFQFNKSQSDWLYFVFRFDCEDDLKRFASSLLDKPFVRTLGKVLEENTLLALMYIPRIEFRKLVNSLTEIIKDGLLKDFEHVILDITKSSQQTISYEFFKNKTWTYDHEAHIKNLRKLVKHARTRKLK
jgi:DNA-binding Lrp family transcriptional regulator